MVWHAVFLRELEIALHSIDRTVAIPYWDWTLDATLADPRTSSIFTFAYFGSSSPLLMDNYEIQDGPLVGWNVSTTPEAHGFDQYCQLTGLMRNAGNFNPAPGLSRYPGGGMPGTLATAAQYQACVDSTSFSQFAHCAWGSVGTGAQSRVHGTMHAWTGGSWTTTGGTADGDIKDPITSPNDPLFFSHHANLDRMYLDFRKKLGDSLATDEDPCGVFYGAEVTYPQPQGHNLPDEMIPSMYYAFRTEQEIETLGPITIAEACKALHSGNYDVEYV